MILLKSVSDCGGFDLDDFFVQWQGLFSRYDGYHDMATKSTLKNIKQDLGADRCGSASRDIAAGARAAGLVLLFRNDPAGLEAAVRSQTRMTHTDPDTVDAAVFFALTARACLKGESPSAAMARMADTRFEESVIAGWTRQGLDAAGNDSVPEVIRFGQSCHTGDAFPGIVQIVARHEQDLAEGIIQAVMAGGDNAARAALVAMVIGAYLGMDEQAGQWFAGLARAEEISRYLKKIP